MKKRRAIQASARRVWFTTQKKREETQAEDLNKDPLSNQKTLYRKAGSKH